MKKSIIAMVSLLILTGCSEGTKETFLIQEKENIFDLYDENGKEITKEDYDGYQKVGIDGYLVKKQDKYGYLLANGKQKIEVGKYQSLEVLGTMIIAKEIKEEQENITIFDSTGKQLYTSSKDVKITIAGLPIIQEGKIYSVLNPDGTLFVSEEKKVIDALIFNDTHLLVNYGDTIMITNNLVSDSKVSIALEGKYALLGADTKKGYLLHNKETNTISLVDSNAKVVFTTEQTFETAFFDGSGNIIGQNQGNKYLIKDKGKTIIEITSYYLDDKNYVIKNKEFVYGPHAFYKDGKEVQVTDIQLDPLASYSKHKIFPVYLKNKGYVYYDFKGEKVIDEIYQKASAFDNNDRAIITKGEDCYLIMKDGKKASSKYVHIELIDNGYYAGYSTENKYEVIDKDGNKVIDDVFMGTKDIVTYGEHMYGIFNKSGKSYIYDMNDEYKVVFDVQGNVVFDEAGHFIVNQKTYYSIEGKKIYPR